MTDAFHEIHQLYTRIRHADDPAERARARAELLTAIPQLQKEQRAGRQQDILLMRERGLTDVEIGELLDLHWARVSAIARGVSAGGSDKKRRRPAGSEVDDSSD